MAFFLLAAVAALSTPALARPTTPCDEQPERCDGLRPDGQDGQEAADRTRPDDAAEKRRTNPGDEEDDDGGSDIGGL